MGLFDFISDAYNAVADAASTVAEKVGDAASAAVDTIGDTTSSTVEVLKNGAESTIDYLGDATTSTVDFVSDTTRSSVEIVGDLAHSAVDKVSHVTDVSIELMSDAKDAVVDYVSENPVTTITTVAGIAGFTTAASLIDFISDGVTPVRGSVLYCDLTFDQRFAEHSGIYIGNNKIVHLNRHGDIEVVTPKQFISGITTGNEIYVSCDGDWPVGCDEAADFAELMIGNSRNYNVLIDNCHQFTAGCLIGDLENNNNFLIFLKDEAKKCLGANNWRLWDKNYW